MRAAVYYSNKDVRLQEMPVPKIGPDEVLVRVHACGICGSDVIEWYRKEKAPLVLGHEIAGTIEEIGNNVSGYHCGDRITVAHHVPCNQCYYCQRGHYTICHTLRNTNLDPGGFSELVRVPAINVDRGLFSIPEEVSFEEASFTEPVACVLRALDTARFAPGDSVLVIGSGIAGLLFISVTRALGARLIMASDVVPFRIQAAKRFGADKSVAAGSDITAQLRQINEGRLADLVIVSTGARKAQVQALECVQKGGTVMFFAPTDAGVTIPVSINNLFFKNDITLTTSYAGSPADYGNALNLIAGGRIKVRDMITHRLALTETAKGFELVARAGDSIKIIINPQK